MNTITSIILTLNEEKNIRRCIKRLQWTDSIVVVDSGSNDKTIEFVREYGCKVYQNKWEGFAKQRNWAIENTDIYTDWVLFVDADEEIPITLEKSIQKSINNTDCSAFYLCAKIYFLGKWVKHCYDYPVWHLRLMKRNAVIFKSSITGHGETWKVKGKIGYIHEPFIHHCFSKGINHWFEKHNNLSSEECNSYLNKKQRKLIRLRNLIRSDKHYRRQTIRLISYRYNFWPLFRYFYQMVLRGGVFDGPAGWTYCALYLAYEIMISAKIKEAIYKEKMKISD